MQTTDVLIVGGGIVGLATAYHLTRENFPRARLPFWKKDPRWRCTKPAETPAVLALGHILQAGYIAGVELPGWKLAMEQFCCRGNRLRNLRQGDCRDE